MAGSRSKPVVGRVAANLQRIRQQRGLSYAELARRLEKAGHPIGDTGLLKIEKGERGVSVDDLVALAVALDTTPNRLLLPEAGEPGELETAAGCAHPPAALWAWASGEVPLGRRPSTAAGAPEGRRREVVFSRENRPHLWHSPAAPAPASRDEAASRVLAVTGMAALVAQAFAAGLSTADIRTVVEAAITAALSEGDPAAVPRIEVADGRITIMTGAPQAPETMEGL